jgi:hypothetical protein
MIYLIYKRKGSGIMKILDRTVVLKALVGSHNYRLNSTGLINKDTGVALPSSDKDYKAFILPTFDELYYGRKFSKMIIGETEDIDIHDIRKIIDLFFKANINFLEVLFSKEYYINNDYPEMARLFELKNDIAKMNLPYLYNSCYGMHKQKMKQLFNGTEGTQLLVDLFGYDTKQALHAYRVMSFIVRFEATGFSDFEGAMRYGGDERLFMLDIKRGLFDRETFEKFIKHFHDATFIHLKEKYHTQPVNKELYIEVEELIMKMVKNHIVGGVA